MPDEHGRLLDELLELRSMTVAVQRSGEVIVRNHIFAISFSGLPHTVALSALCLGPVCPRPTCYDISTHATKGRRGTHGSPCLSCKAQRAAVLVLGRRAYRT